RLPQGKVVAARFGGRLPGVRRRRRGIPTQCVLGGIGHLSRVRAGTAGILPMFWDGPRCYGGGELWVLVAAVVQGRLGAPGVLEHDRGIVGTPVTVADR